jgi:hypothetical protein
MKRMFWKLWKAWNSYIYSNVMTWTFLIFTSAVCLLFYIIYEKIFSLIGWTVSFAIMFQRFINWYTSQEDSEGAKHD